VTNVSRATQALISYIGSDVSNSAALVLAIEAPTPQAGDSIARSLRVLYSESRECAGGDNNPNGSTMRLFFGPTTRIRCERAQVLNESGGPISASFQLP
jgi:hypothetical protein